MEITGNTFFMDWEVSLMIWLQSHIGSFGEELAIFFTILGEPVLMFLLLSLFYLGFDKKYGKYLTVNLFSVCVLGSMLKNIVLRRRPYFDNDEIKCLHPASQGDIHDISLQGYSFPSLHSATSINFYTSIARYVKNNALRIVCIIIPFLVGISRSIVGVHYPTDVLCGWIFGLLVMLLIDRLNQKLPSTNVVIGIMLVISLPGFFFCKSTDFYTSWGILAGCLLAFLFEEHHVNFKPAKNVLFLLFRFVLGVVLALGLEVLLKLPFPNELLASATTVSFLIRTARYAIIGFVTFGVYPLCFGKGKIDL